MENGSEKKINGRLAVLEEKVRKLEEETGGFQTFSRRCENQRRNQEDKIFQELAEIRGGIKALKFLILLVGAIFTILDILSKIHGKI